MKGFFKIFAIFCMISGNAVLAENGEDGAGRWDQYATDPLNARYLIEESGVRLMDGRAERVAAPRSAMKTRTAVLGQPVYGDLNGDGNKDAALLLTHDPGGSGTFYYVAAAINVNGRFQGTNAVLLGDRIALVDVGIRNGTVLVNYADRRPEEPMSAAPTVDQKVQLILKHDKLESVETPVSADPASSPLKITFDLRCF